MRRRSGECESYWSLLESAGDGVGPLPRRWSRELLRRLEVVTGDLAQEGGFIDAIEDFDAGSSASRRVRRWRWTRSSG